MNVNRPSESANQIWQAIETRDESSGADVVLFDGSQGQGQGPGVVTDGLL
jgi:hypothetical protein